MPRSHWLLAVLEDLRAYAAEHKLIDLERHLRATEEVAQSELASKAAGGSGAQDERGTD